MWRRLLLFCVFVTSAHAQPVLQAFKDNPTGLITEENALLQDYPSALVGRWVIDQVNETSGSRTHYAMNYYKSGRYLNSLKVYSSKSMREEIIDRWGGDSLRIAIVADSLTAAGSKYGDFLNSKGQQVVLESTGVWGADDDSLRILPERWALYLNTLLKFEIFVFYDEVLPLMAGKEEQKYIPFSAITYVGIMDSYINSIKDNFPITLGMWETATSINEYLFVVNGENRSTFTRYYPPGIYDFDSDGSVGFGDFILFAKNFGQEIENLKFDERFDTDGDGIVGFSDFVTFTRYIE